MNKRGLNSFLASIISIFAGLVVGFILLLCFNSPKAIYGLRVILTTGFSKVDRMAKVLYTAAPLIMTGLSVGFAFKTGLFNIGASGQYTVGAFFALLGAIVFRLPWWACILLAMLGGAVWGAIPGIFKALFNVNEVITSIMFNWIGLYAVNLAINNLPLMLASSWGAVNKDRTAALASANSSAVLPKLGLDELFDSRFINIGVFLAIFLAFVLWIVLSKTTFGYELKACGYNRNASLYAGINAKRSIILSMTIAGAMAGIGGAIYYLSGTAQFTLEKTLLGMGFNGIPVALLASSNPLGTILSALFISYIQVGGDYMQPEFNKEIIDIIIAVIIYLSAFSMLVREVLAQLGGKRAEKQKEADKA